MYVLCVSYPGEWEQIERALGEEYPDAKPVQKLPMQRLDQHDAVAAAFFIGDEKRDGERTMHLTEPVYASEHWAPDAGYGGSVKANTFLEALGKLCLPRGGMSGGASIKPMQNGVIRIAYG